MDTLNQVKRKYDYLLDDEFCFVIWTCPRDKHLAINLINRLRRLAYNPKQKILVIGDNVGSFPVFERLDFIDLKSSPKTLDYGDQYMFDRWSIALDWMETPYIIRLDPDTEVIRRVDPIRSEWFGFLYKTIWGIGCSGGSSGYSKKTLEGLMSRPNSNYRLTYPNGDGVPCMADDSLLIRYIGKELGVDCEPWPNLFIDLVFRRGMLKSGWMMTHPCLDKPLNAHLPKIVIDEGSSDAAQVAIALNAIKFDGLIYTEDPRPYFEQGFRQFTREPKYSENVAYKTLAIRNNNYVAGLNGPVVGGIQDCQLWDAWFSSSSCLYRKKATWNALNNTARLAPWKIPMSTSQDPF